jgi:hypothetical protein
VHEEADRFLRGHDGSGTRRTYAYFLVDHLRWLERECLALGKIQLRDLERYMGIVGAEVLMPLGEPRRAGKRPYGRAALSAAAACLRASTCTRHLWTSTLSWARSSAARGCRRGRIVAGRSSGT